jgi:hypothetical protein
MTDEYWKRPEQSGNKKSVDPGIGIWSRSRVFRAIMWVATLLVAVFLALVASAYLSGFDSFLEMIDWVLKSSHLLEG